MNDDWLDPEEYGRLMRRIMDQKLQEALSLGLTGDWEADKRLVKLDDWAKQVLAEIVERKSK